MIIHFWELPEERNYIILKENYNKKIISILEEENYPWKIKNKIKKGKISIKKLKDIAQKEKISLDIIEKNILWIGGNNSKGLSNPKFPINLSTRRAARFIAAIVNDGTLTKNGERNKAYGRLMYDNFDESLRNSVIKDCIATFGGKAKEIAFRNTEKKKYLEFSSIMRDMVELIIKSKGPKCESNIPVPKFILENNDLIAGWIEQTIADEGEIKFYPSKYRRAIIWRRSLDVTPLFSGKIKKDTPLRKLPESIQGTLEEQKCKLISDEEKMLSHLGIDYIIYNLGVYLTEYNKVRTKWQIMITKRENLFKLRKIIKIPSKEKDKKFNLITKGFIRFKEPLRIKEIILNISKNKKPFTSLDLAKKMNYKQLNTAIKWIKIFEKEGLIKKIKESSYGNGKYRTPSQYMLIQDK